MHSLKPPRAGTVLYAIAATLAALVPIRATPADPPREFSAVRGDRASGWLAQTPSEVLARNGMVATSQPLAAQAGLDILKKGGNAFDAAVATAAVLNVVEPGSAGLGGDVFVIAWVAKEKKLIALNGSGRAPSGASREYLASRSKSHSMPLHGIDSVTVPGALLPRPQQSQRRGPAQASLPYAAAGLRDAARPARHGLRPDGR